MLPLPLDDSCVRQQFSSEINIQISVTAEYVRISGANMGGDSDIEFGADLTYVSGK